MCLVIYAPRFVVRSRCPPVRGFIPVFGCDGIRLFAPLPAGITPERAVVVAARVHEREILGVRYGRAIDFKWCDVHFMSRTFVVVRGAPVVCTERDTSTVEPCHRA